MLEALTILLAFLSMHEGHWRRKEQTKMLWTELGMEPGYLYEGMPFVGGVTVVTYPDGHRLVRLLTLRDFQVMGNSMDTKDLGGPVVGDAEERTGESFLWKASEAGTAMVYAYVDERNIPQFSTWLSTGGEPWSLEEHPPGRVSVGGSVYPHLTLRNRDGPFLGLPSDKGSRLLTFWLDLGDRVVQSIPAQVALVIPDEVDPVQMRERAALWNHKIPYESDAVSWNRNYFTLMALKEKEDAWRMDEEDEDELGEMDAWIDRSEHQYLDAARELFRHLEDNLDLKVDQIKRRRLRSTGATTSLSVKLAMPGSTYDHLNEYSHTLKMLIRRPSVTWMRNRMEEGPRLELGVYRFGKPLVAWVLIDEGDDVLGEVSFWDGPLTLLDEHLDLAGSLEEWAAGQVAFADEFRESVPRTWKVPLDYAVTPTSEIQARALVTSNP